MFSECSEFVAEYIRKGIINGLKIVFIFHPLPTLPPQGGGTNYNPLSPGGRGLPASGGAEGDQGQG